MSHRTAKSCVFHCMQSKVRLHMNTYLTREEHFQRDDEPALRRISELLLLKGKSNRNAFKYAVISYNDFNLMASLNHRSHFSSVVSNMLIRLKHREDDCPEAISEVARPECQAWVIYENPLTGTFRPQICSFHEGGDHPYQYLKPLLLTLTWLMEVMQRPW